VPRKQNDDVLAVWDLDNSAWRSFRLDSIIEVQLQ
jgi:predicted DNA-binding transcriptional regulator YafY